MIVSSVRLSGLERTVKKLERVKNILDSGEFKSEMDIARSQSYQLWSKNIYRWFDARIRMGFSNTGQLGRSLVVGQTAKSITFSMVGIYHNGTEYGSLLRKGFGPSPGKYLPYFDRRVKYGVHPGYDGRTWMKWITWFRENNKMLYINATQRAVDRLVRS